MSRTQGGLPLRTQLYGGRQQLLNQDPMRHHAEVLRTSSGQSISVQRCVPRPCRVISGEAKGTEEDLAAECHHDEEKRWQLQLR